MGQANCVVDIVDKYAVIDERDIDIGADLFLGREFYRPMPKNSYHQMMRAWKPEYLHFKTRNNVILQFRIGEFRSKTCVIYTDTNNNTWYFFKGKEAGYARTITNSNINRKCYRQRIEYLEGMWRDFRVTVRSEKLNFPVEEINKITDVLYKRRELYADRS
jgi:hypothetical protein